MGSGKPLRNNYKPIKNRPINEGLEFSSFGFCLVVSLFKVPYKFKMLLVNYRFDNEVVVHRSATASTMATTTTTITVSAFLYGNGETSRLKLMRLPSTVSSSRKWRSLVSLTTPVRAKQEDQNQLLYRKVGDSDLQISEITLGTVTTLCFLFMYITFSPK